MTSLGELGALFFKLGATSFGGPAAHVAMMHDEVVVRRGWLTEEAFLDRVSAAALIPGPNSTELALHIGWERRRLPGLLVAGFAFIAPAAAITGALAWAYVRFGSLPTARQAFRFLPAVIAAVILHAAWTMAPKAAKTRSLRVIAALATAAAFLRVHELFVLVGAGFLAITTRPRGPSTSSGSLFLVAPAFGAVATTATPSSIFFTFAKIGSLLFGSGYVLVAFLRAELVKRLGWLTEAQLVDAVTAGQLTPGPVFSTATFVGYVLGRVPGALAATVGIFLPAFVLVGLSGPLIPRLRASARAGAFLDGVNVASLALMVVVTADLGRSVVTDLPSVAVLIAAAVALVRFRVNASVVLIVALVSGLVVGRLGR